MKKLIFAIILFLMASDGWCGSSRDWPGSSTVEIDYPVPSGLTVGTDSFTMMCWIFWTHGPDVNNDIVSQADGTGTGRSLMFIDSSNILRSFLGGVATISGETVPQDVWSHVAVVSDEGAGTVGIFLNAVGATATRAPEAATGNFRLGRSKSATNSDFEGQISDFVIVEQALTTAQITSTFYNQLEYYGLAGSNVTIDSHIYGQSPEIDLSGNGNNGTVNGPTVSANGPPNYFPQGGN